MTGTTLFSAIELGTALTFPKPEQLIHPVSDSAVHVKAGKLLALQQTTSDIVCPRPDTEVRTVDLDLPLLADTTTGSNGEATAYERGILKALFGGLLRPHSYQLLRVEVDPTANGILDTDPGEIFLEVMRGLVDRSLIAPLVIEPSDPTNLPEYQFRLTGFGFAVMLNERKIAADTAAHNDN